MRKAYTSLLYLALPAILGFLAWRGIRDRGWLRRWSERFGRIEPGAARHGIVIHAASFGEVNAAAPLVSALLQQAPGIPIMLTTFTPTGSNRVRALFGSRLAHAYAPLDLPGAVRRFFDRLQPRLLVIMETEVWPNLYAQASRRGVPTVLVNARLSETSVRGYRKAPGLVREALAGLSWAGAQSPGDAERLIECGAPSGRTVVTGNIKHDLSVAPTLAAEASELRARWGAERPVITAGSTRPGDEDVLIPAFLQVRKRHPQALLIVAPRHPERFADTARKAGLAGLRVALRSAGEACPPDADCFVIDTMGELMRYYACADMAFVGGTFAEIGGHNLLEPAALGKPVLFGPHTYNTEQVALALEACGGGRRLESREALERAIIGWIDDTDARGRAGAAALRLAEEGRGALAETLGVIHKLLARS